VVAPKDARVNRKNISESKKHALEHGPGAYVAASTTRTVQRIAARAQQRYAEFISSDVCVTIKDAAANRASTVERTDLREALWKQYMKISKEWPQGDRVGRTFFFAHWPKDISDPNNIAECICDTCHQRGTMSAKAFSHLMERIAEIFHSIPGVAGMAAIINDMYRRALDTLL
jgi:arylamine N-acetyltransferase